MRILTVLILVIITGTAFADYEQWKKYKEKYSKTYKSLKEETTRYNIFRSNLQRIEAHNLLYANGKETYKMGITKFADLTEDEFEKLWLMPPVHTSDTNPRFSATPGVIGASSVDWRTKGAVLEVVDQLGCGSCWAISAVGSIEGQNFIKHNKSIALSVQELVDCTSKYGSGGCNGGWMYQAFNYVQFNGIIAENDYKYEGQYMKCRNTTAAKVDLKLTGYRIIDKDAEALRQAVETVGPISITIYHKGISLYKEGIINPTYCDTTPTHAVLVVGYGSENGMDYWIVRNSWGKDWGEKGYFRIIRNQNNTCGIYDYAMYPLIS